MNADKEVATKYLKQVCIAVAILLVLYGIVQLLNFLLELANSPAGYRLLFLFQKIFQIIAALLVIFIGFRVFSIAKTVRLTNLTLLWETWRNQILGILLGSLPLIPLMLYPLPNLSPPFYSVIPLTISEFNSNPEFWLWKRVRVQGVLVGPLAFIPEAVPPYNYALYDPVMRESMGILWKNPDGSLDGKNVWVIGVVKKERAPGVFGKEAYFIEAEMIVRKPIELLGKHPLCQDFQ
jgi:hypothetical protein